MKKISIITSTLVLLSTMLQADISIKNGWQLLGATQDINASIFDNTCVDYIWKYDATDINNAQWQVHVANAVEYNHNMTAITSLVKGEGYWVKGNGTCVISLAETPKSMLKATGQTFSYNEAGTIVTDGSVKDDGYYQRGVTTSYTRDDVNGTVTDNVTKLMWQDDATPVTTYTWDAAHNHCSALTLDGYPDWRLPTRSELASIVDYSNSNLSVDTGIFQHTVS